MKYTIGEDGLTLHADEAERVDLCEQAAYPDRWAAILEHLERTDLDNVRPEDIGALTDAPILSDGVSVWWFPNYALEDPTETLYRTGSVVFAKGYDIGAPDDTARFQHDAERVYNDRRIGVGWSRDDSSTNRGGVSPSTTGTVVDRVTVRYPIDVGGAIQRRLEESPLAGIEPVAFLEALMSCDGTESVDLLTNSGQDVLDTFYGVADDGG